MRGPVAAQPLRGLYTLMGAQIVLWTLAPLLAHQAPPLDVVEMYVWGREWVLATFKHPNLPGLMLEPIRALTGQAGWPAFVLSQLCIATTFWAVYQLGRELMDAPRALAGTLLLTGVYFFTWVTPEFNHNVLQMPLWAGVMFTLWRASAHGRSIDWVWLGVIAGLSLWAKYSSGILLLIAACWIVWDAQTRKRLLTLGPWLGSAAFAVVAAPQALWLYQNAFAPFAYAARRADGGAWYAPFEFLLTLALDCLPMLVLLAASGLLLGKAMAGAPEAPDKRAWRFLLLLGLGPALLTALLALFTGAGLRSSWGAPMLSLTGLMAVAALSAKFTALRLQRLYIGAYVLIALTAVLYFAHMEYGVGITNKPLRGNWPQAQISATLQEEWRTATNDAPLRIVTGDVWTAGLIGFHDREPPSVLINGDYEAAPWVTAADVDRDGALVVWSGPLPAALAGFLDAHALQTQDWIYYPRRADVDAPEAQIRVHYAILPPAER